MNSLVCYRSAQPSTHRSNVAQQAIESSPWFPPSSGDLVVGEPVASNTANPSPPPGSQVSPPPLPVARTGPSHAPFPYAARSGPNHTPSPYPSVHPDPAPSFHPTHQIRSTSHIQPMNELSTIQPEGEKVGHHWSIILDYLGFI